MKAYAAAMDSPSSTSTSRRKNTNPSPSSTHIGAGASDDDVFDGHSVVNTDVSLNPLPDGHAVVFTDTRHPYTDRPSNAAAAGIGTRKLGLDDSWSFTLNTVFPDTLFTISIENDVWFPPEPGTAQDNRISSLDGSMDPESVGLRLVRSWNGGDAVVAVVPPAAEV